jgi:hypothetical protein
VKAYRNETLLDGRDGRSIRILAEYLEPLARFGQQHVETPSAPNLRS